LQGYVRDVQYERMSKEAVAPALCSPLQDPERALCRKAVRAPAGGDGADSRGADGALRHAQVLAIVSLFVLIDRFFISNIAEPGAGTLSQAVRAPAGGDGAGSRGANEALREAQGCAAHAVAERVALWG